MPAPRAFLLGLTLALALAGCDRPGAAPGAFNGIDITGAEFARRLDAQDLDGKPRSLADWRGKVTVVFFGYTHCPDVCPATLAELAEVKRVLGAAADRLQVVFVTLDPERDTPDVLRRYVTNFDPGVVALRATPEGTAAIAKEFKVFYAKVPGKAAGSYTVDHTAASFVFDADGKPRLYEAYGKGAAAMAADIRRLLGAG